jgi:type VI secretion system protein ImpG
LAKFVGSSLTLSIQFGRKPDLPSRIGPEHLRLNCTPIINLYHEDGQPIVPDPGRIEYRLVPSAPTGRHAKVYAINTVRGSVQGRQERVVYHPFESLRHMLPGASGTFYRARLRPAVVGSGCDMWLSFVNGTDRVAVPAADTISTSLTCTDGAVAELIPIGGIDRVAVGSPASMKFRNITPVTSEVPPPLQGDTLWRLVSGLARSLRTLNDIVTLRALVAAYDFRAAYDDRERQRLNLLLGALQDITVEAVHVLIDGIPARGQHITLTVSERGFGGAEGAYLFGSVLNGFLDVYVNPNTCCRLTVIGSETRVVFNWPLRTRKAGSP